MSNEKNLTVDQTFDLAVQNHQNNNFQDAQYYYQKVLKIDPDHINTHNNLGVIFKKLGENQKAKECFEKVIKIDPNYAGAHNNLGVIFIELGENQKAKECFEKAIEINPNYADAYNNLGAIFQELEEIEKAKECFVKAIAINPDYAGAHNNLGVIFIELGENQKAKECFKKVIMLEPGFIDVINSVNKGDWQNSKNFLTKVCTNKIVNMKKYIDEFIALWCLRCNNLLANGDIEGLSQIYIRLLMMGKTNHNLNNLTKLLFETIDINLILELVETNDKILINVSYCQYKFENKDFLLSEELAVKNIQDAKNLIKNTVTEDLGWLIVKRSLVLFKNKNFAKKILKDLITT